MGHLLKDACNYKTNNGLAENKAVPETVPETSRWDASRDTMTAVEMLRQRASKMPHAIVRDRIIDAGGRVEAEREFHYLTCRRCDLERQAEFIEGRN